MAYVFCPTCNDQIPAILRCRGTVVPEHKGLFFRSCGRCGFLSWMPPPSKDPCGINPGEAFGANDPFPRNEDLRSPPPPPPPEIDPLLGLHAIPSTPASLPPPRAPPATAPAPASTSDASKPLCAHPHCKRIASAKNCTNSMCKTCCQLSPTSCAYAQHRNSTPVVAANGNPSALARPPAIVQPSAAAAAAAASKGARWRCRR